MRRSRWPLVAVVAMVAGFAAIGSPPPAPAAESARVLMVDNEPDLTRWHYDPAEVTVPAGSTVVWFNQGEEDHTVTADDRSFDSGYKKKGASWQRAFPRPGKYSYHCAPHPWMKGTVVVVAADAPVPRTAAAAGDAGSSTTTAPAPGAPAPAVTSTTFPASLAATTTTADSATTAPVETTPSTDEGSEEHSAAPAASRKGSGGPLAGTIAVVLLPTLGALGLGARLRRSKVGPA